jgi:hypothetical protein
LSRQVTSKKQKQDGIRLLGKPKQQKGRIANKTQISSDTNELQNGLAKLVLTIVKVLVDLLERQAEHKVISGSLTEDEMERLGSALIKIRQTLRDITTKFGFRYEDLDIPIASAENRIVNIDNSNKKQLLSAPMLVDILDRLINKQTVIAGQIVISVADIDLIILNLLGSFLSSKNYRDSGDDGR